MRYDPIAPGKVNVNVHIAEKEDSDWKALELTEDAEKYPVAVIPGQRQYAFSVYDYILILHHRFSKRFGPQKKKHILPPVVPPVEEDAQAVGN